MKKKLIALLLAIVTVLSIVTMFAVTSYAASVGYTVSKTVNIRCANANTELCQLKKYDPGQTYSKILVYKSGSEISYMHVWVTNITNKKMSDKIKTYPDDQTYTIKYYSGTTFVKDATIKFWGEQPNILVQKAAHFAAYSY